MFHKNFTANGTENANSQSGSGKVGNFTTLYAKGTWGGGTIKVQISPDGSNWFDVTDANLTADGFANIQVKAPYMRVDLSGATSPDLNVWLA